MHGKIAAKTNISKAQYDHIVDDIEHEPLIRRPTLTVAAFLAAIAILLGCLVWFAKASPGNLIRAEGTVSSISSGRTDSLGNESTFVTFDFKTRQNETKSVRQHALPGIDYAVGQKIAIGYHPKNTNYARLLDVTRPPEVSLWLWTVPFLLMVWFIFVALFRHHARQVEIWKAAEAADSEE